MNDKEMILAMYNKYSEQISGLYSRRQIDNRYFLTICLALLSALGWMHQNKAFLVENQSLIIISTSMGIMIALSWWAMLTHYNRSLKSTYNVLREMETPNLPYPLYKEDHAHLISGIKLKKPLKYLRHYVPILSFLIVFVFFLFSAL